MSKRVVEFSVAKSAQTSGGGDYIVKYEAEVELLENSDDVSVEVRSTVPAAPDPAMVDQIAIAIRRGAIAALGGRGAILRLSRLAVHPVDFKAHRFEQITADALLNAIGE